MSDFEQRAYIKMRTALNFSAVDIHTDLVNVHQDSAYAYRTVVKWVSLFKAGREIIEDDPRSGRPVTATSPTEIELIKGLIDKTVSLLTTKWKSSLRLVMELSIE